jgi:beta-lactamase regulating signal transducer with metallopeptidase domain
MIWSTLLESGQSDYLCLTLLHSLWQVAILAGFAFGLERAWQRQSAEWAYAAHVVALVIGLALMPFTYAWIQSAESAAQPLTPDAAIASVVSTESAATLSPSPVADASNARSLPTATTSVAAIWPRMARWIAMAYVAGVVLMLGRLTSSIVRVERMRRLATPIVDGAFAVVCRRVSEQWSLRRKPVLAHVDGIVVPQVVGLLRPMILLPTSLITGLSPDELVMILLHEFAHVRRHDLWVNLLQRLAEVLLFFNPALWYLSRRISALREICCDELACGQLAENVATARIGYANALVRIAELARASSATQLQLTALAASGQSPSELRRRVARLLGEPLPERLSLSRGGTFAIAFFALVIVCSPIMWPATAQSADEKAPKNESKEGTAEVKEKRGGGAVLEGRVTDEYGKPLPGVQVKLYSGIGSRWLGQETTTDAQGDYRFDPLETGGAMGGTKDSDPSWYTGVVFKHYLYVPADGKSWRDITVPMKKGHVEVFDMKMTRGGKIDGYIEDDQTGKPAANLDLRIHNGHATGKKDGDFHVYATTDDKGRFLSDALMPGKYVVEINDNNFRGKDRYPKIAEARVESGRTSHVQAVTCEMTQLQDPFQIMGKALGDDGKSMIYGGVGMRLKDGKGKLRTRGGGIDGRNVFGLIFGPIEREKVTEDSPYGVGTYDVELFGNNKRDGYELVSRTPSEPLRITDDPNQPELEDGYRYIRPNQPLELQLVFKKVNPGTEESDESKEKSETGKEIGLRY